MQKMHLTRVKQYGSYISKKRIEALRYSASRIEDIEDAKKVVRQRVKTKLAQSAIEVEFVEKGVGLSIKNRTVATEIARRRGPKGEDIRFFGEVDGIKHNYGTYWPNIDLIEINSTMCAKGAHRSLTEILDQYELIERRIRNKYERRKIVEALVERAMRKTKTPNLEDHRLIADIFEQLGIIYHGREIEDLAKNEPPQKVFEELTAGNIKITTLHETRHQRDSKQDNPTEVDEFLAHLTELASLHTALGILQLPVNRNRLESQNANQRGVELLFVELSKYLGIYGVRDIEELKRRVNDILDFDQIIFRRAAQSILEKQVREGKYFMGEEEMREMGQMDVLEGKLRDYVFGT